MSYQSVLPAGMPRFFARFTAAPAFAAPWLRAAAYDDRLLVSIRLVYGSSAQSACGPTQIGSTRQPRCAWRDTQAASSFVSASLVHLLSSAPPM